MMAPSKFGEGIGEPPIAARPVYKRAKRVWLGGFALAAVVVVTVTLLSTGSDASLRKVSASMRGVGTEKIGDASVEVEPVTAARLGDLPCPDGDCPPATRADGIEPTRSELASSSKPLLMSGPLNYATRVQQQEQVVNLVFASNAARMSSWVWAVWQYIVDAVPYRVRMHYVPGKQKGEHWHKVCLPNTILVFFDNRVRWSIKSFVEVCGDNMPFGLIHLSDIKMRRKGGYSVYSNENLVFVYRHHYPSDEQVKKLKIPAEALAKVYLLPLGSIAGKTATRIAPPATSSLPLRAADRAIWCSFLGTAEHHQDRQDMMAGLTKAKMVIPFKMDKKDKSYMHAKGLPQTLATEEGQAVVGGKRNVCLIYGAKKFMADDNVSPFEYYRIIQDSVFHPAPSGKGPFSFRLYEALDYGAIPIVPDIAPFNRPLGEGHPLPKLKPGEWEEGVPRLLRQFYNDPVATAELQARVVDWWYEFSTKWRKQLTANVERLIAANKGDTLPEAPPLVPTDMPW